MKKNAYENTTIRKAAKLLRHLQRQKNCNLAEPESVKLCIGSKNCSNAHKENLVEAYTMVAKYLGLTWEQPFYTRYSRKTQRNQN